MTDQQWAGRHGDLGPPWASRVWINPPSLSLSPQCPHNCHSHSAGVLPVARGHPWFGARSHRCHWVWGHYYIYIYIYTYIYINTGIFLNDFNAVRVGEPAAGGGHPVLPEPSEQSPPSPRCAHGPVPSRGRAQRGGVPVPPSPLRRHPAPPAPLPPGRAGPPRPPRARLASSSRFARAGSRRRSRRSRRGRRSGLGPGSGLGRLLQCRRFIYNKDLKNKKKKMARNKERTDIQEKRAAGCSDIQQ